MKSANSAPAAKSQTIIAVDPKDKRMATVVHGGKVIFTIKTDVSGANPSIVVVATETHLKSMEKGKTGIVLWNGAAGLHTRNLKLH